MQKKFLGTLMVAVILAVGMQFGTARRQFKRIKVFTMGKE